MGLMWVINTLRLDTSKSEYVLQPYTILTAYSLSTSPTHHPCRHIVHSWKAAWIHTVPAHPVTWNTPWYSTCSRSAFELYLCCASYFNFNFNPTAVWRCIHFGGAVIPPFRECGRLCQALKMYCMQTVLQIFYPVAHQKVSYTLTLLA